MIAVCSRVVGANDIAVELELIETAETKRSHSEAPASSPVSIQTQSLALRALRALRLDGNRAKRKRLRWQAANHGCHCFDRASYWLLQRQYIVE